MKFTFWGTSSGAPNDRLTAALIGGTTRVVGGAYVWWRGFRAVSDDDFARVVIAQRFAHAPQLDPTGSSWLPLPFWTVGSAMHFLGTSLSMARAIAWCSAALGGALVAWVAVAAGLSPRRTYFAAAAAALMPWGMQLAVSTVPEAPAAACAAAGALTLASNDPDLRFVGGTALLASCLSRYDAWPMALAFAAWSALDALRARRGKFLVAALLAVAGPVAWSVWQAASYGDAFRYLRLVRTYRQALGATPRAWRILGYPLGAYEEMREVVGAAVAGLAARGWLVRRSAGREPCLPDLQWTRPLSVSGLQILVLIAGDLRDGAPTHHPERALLAPATVVLFASVDAVGAMIEQLASRRLQYQLLGAAILTFVSWSILRLHHSIPWYATAPRTREVAAGTALARVAQATERVLLDTRDLAGGELDYGYYAVLSAFGRPFDAEVDRDQDPRHPRYQSGFRSAQALRDRAAETHSSVVLAWGERHAESAVALGATVLAEETNLASAIDGGRWHILRLP